MPDQTNLDPQAAVDAVLGGATTPTPTPVPAMPVLVPLQPKLEDVPTELVNVSQVDPTLTPVPLSPTPAMNVGENTPLAFVGSSPISNTNESSVVAQAKLPTVESVLGKPKKKRTGLVVGGILFLIIALGSGVWGYNILSKKPQVAFIAECSVDLDCGNGNRCAGGRCINGSGNGEEDDDSDEDKKDCRDGDIIECSKGGCWGTKTCNDNAWGSCVLDDPNCGKPTTVQCSATKPCTNGAVCAADGKCMDPGGPVGCGSVDYCSDPVMESGGSQYCNDQGQWCRQIRMECILPDTKNTHCFMRNEEKCSPGIDERCVNTPSTPDSPTMSCSSITTTPTAPVLGNTVSLTCLGAVTPASAGALSYKFRYSINGGTYTALTNTTDTTASLTIAACGTYSVQCQACATLDGVLTCDPVWTGATTN